MTPARDIAVTPPAGILIAGALGAVTGLGYGAKVPEETAHDEVPQERS